MKFNHFKDSSPQIIEKWVPIFEEKGISVISSTHFFNLTIWFTLFAQHRKWTRRMRICQEPRHRSKPWRLSLLSSSFSSTNSKDADDWMLPERIEKQLKVALEDSNAIVGCNFKRFPKYSIWLKEIQSIPLNDSLTGTIRWTTKRFGFRDFVNVQWRSPRGSVIVKWWLLWEDMLRPGQILPFNILSIANMIENLRIVFRVTRKRNVCQFPKICCFFTFTWKEEERCERFLRLCWYIAITRWLLTILFIAFSCHSFALERLNDKCFPSGKRWPSGVRVEMVESNLNL